MSNPAHSLAEWKTSKIPFSSKQETGTRGEMIFFIAWAVQFWVCFVAMIGMNCHWTARTPVKLMIVLSFIIYTLLVFSLRKMTTNKRSARPHIVNRKGKRIDIIFSMSVFFFY
jgi:cytosine/uracil/thiamine/allantoin permease